MKFNRIFLVRHGQSEGNVDKKVYNIKPDHAVKLTELGEQQAFETGVKLKKMIGLERVGIYSSPYTRTRETAKGIMKSITPEFYNEDIRLREHEWAEQIIDSDKLAWEKKAEEFGVTFFRFPTGESCADVFNRISTFFIDLRHEYEEEYWGKYGYVENLIIVGHGMTNRVILMKLLKLSPEEFERIENMRNGELYILDSEEIGSYRLNILSDIRYREKSKRIF